MKVKRLYHRNNPILLGAPPTRPPCEFNYMRCFMRSALIWQELEKAGVPDVTGVKHPGSLFFGLLTCVLTGMAAISPAG